MQTALAASQFVVAIVQVFTLAALVVTTVMGIRGIRLATAQARASEAQAKASEQQAKSSEQMARLSLQQTELMRTQLHASFKPIVEVIGSESGPQSTTLVLKNLATSPALALIAVCRNGSRENLGSLAPEGTARFRFDHSFNLPPPPPVGSLASREQFKVDIQPVPLRLEYSSMSGARYCTKADFKLDGERPIEPHHEHEAAVLP